MTGDGDDMVQRLRSTLPARWFNDVAPVLDGVLVGLSASWVALYSLIQFVKLQSRVATVSDQFLDLAAKDFFSVSLLRRAAEDDETFRARLQVAMRRERATRAALEDAAAASGYSITVFEAARPADTGAFNVATSLAWGAAGAWGSLQMPLECLVIARGGPPALEQELQQGLAAAMPAGGAAWVHVSSQ